MTEATNRPRRRKQRRRMRAVYIRNCTICTIVALLAGLTIGFGCGWVARNSRESKSSVIPSELQVTENGTSSNHTIITTTAPKPTASSVSPSVVDYNGISWGTIENPFRIGNAYSLMADTTVTGEAHSELETAPFTSQNLSVSLVDFYTPEHYEHLFGSEYRLSGTEAAAILRISSDKLCNPQTAIVLTFETADGGCVVVNAVGSENFIPDSMHIVYLILPLYSAIVGCIITKLASVFLNLVVKEKEL